MDIRFRAGEKMIDTKDFSSILKNKQKQIKLAIKNQKFELGPPRPESKEIINGILDTKINGAVLAMFDIDGIWYAFTIKNTDNYSAIINLLGLAYDGFIAENRKKHPKK